MTRTPWQRLLFVIALWISIAPSAYAHVTIGSGVKLNVGSAVMTADSITVISGTTVQTNRGRVYVNQWHNHGVLFANAGSINIRMGDSYVTLHPSAPKGQCLQWCATTAAKTAAPPTMINQPQDTIQALHTPFACLIWLKATIIQNTTSQHIHLNTLLGAPQHS